jgi:hypothetical protein
MSHIDELNPAYSQARFRSDLAPECIAQKFCIVTACFPIDEEVTAAENESFNRALKTELKKADLVHFPVTGYSPNSDHEEPGYGIICDRAMAIKLGQQFRQNTIFSVYGDTVHLINCTPPHQDIPCGKWGGLLD